jgi:hypothetical protein
MQRLHLASQLAANLLHVAPLAHCFVEHLGIYISMRPYYSTLSAAYSLPTWHRALQQQGWICSTACSASFSDAHQERALHAAAALIIANCRKLCK